MGTLQVQAGSQSKSGDKVSLVTVQRVCFSLGVSVPSLPGVRDMGVPAISLRPGKMSLQQSPSELDQRNQPRLKALAPEKIRDV